MPEGYDLRIVSTVPVLDPEQDEPEVIYEEFLKLTHLDEDARRNLAVSLLEQIDQILLERAPLEEKIRMYRNQYHQIVEQSSDPFPGCFSMNVPITPKHVDTALAETDEIFEGTDPKWTIQGPANKQFQPMIDTQQDVLDSYEDLSEKKAEDRDRIYFDAWLLGNGWEAKIHKREVLTVRKRKTWNDITQFQDDFPGEWQKQTKIVSLLERGKKVGRLIEYKKIVWRGPVSEHVEWEDAIVPLGTRGIDGIQSAYLIARRVWMSWWQIKELEEAGEYESGVSEELKYRADRENDGTYKRGELNADYLKQRFETFEVICSLEIPTASGKKRLIRSLVNVERSHMLYLRGMRYPYHHDRVYLIPYMIQQVRNGIYQPGIGEKLQNLNLSINALVDHVLNTGIIATTLSGKVRTNTDAARSVHEKKWYPGSMMELMNPDDFQEISFNSPDLSIMVKLIELLITFADDVTGLNSNLAGQADPEDPTAPGVKTAMLLRKSERKLRKYVKTLKRSVNESGYQSIRLIFQYLPTETIAAVTGKSEQEVEDAAQMDLPIVAHATVFDVDRIMKNQEASLYSALLFKEPIIQNDPVRRIKLIRMMAENATSDWRGKIDELLPSDSELERMATQGKVTPDMVLKNARDKAVQAGHSPEEADQIAQMTVQRMTQLAQNRGGNGGPAAPVPAESPFQ